jgi:hypothetical protein
LIIISFSAEIKAQDSFIVERDSLSEGAGFLTFPDSVVMDASSVKKKIETVAPKEAAFKPNSTKAVIYSAVFPGLGQIYNRKYWKLPIVYGGFLGCYYAISWNGNQYNGYKDAYRDFTHDIQPGSQGGTHAWKDFLPYSMIGMDDDPLKWPDSERTWFRSALKNKRDYYRRDFELSIIVTVGLYALCMIDAYVDAQLFDFDISQDLSLRFDPVIMQETASRARTFGLQCSFTF